MNETITELMRVMATTTDRMIMNEPISPPSKPIGTKTTIAVSIEARTAVATSWVPLMTASRLFKPSFFYGRWIQE